VSDITISAPTTTEVLRTTTVGYHDAYELRRASSTMTRVALEHLRGRLAAARADHHGRPRPLRVLSLGCGDGDLDAPLLRALCDDGPVDYVGVDVNARSLDRFRARLRLTLPSTPGVDRSISLIECSLEDITDPVGFDVVLLAHVLYYVSDPVALLQGILERLVRTDGRVIVVQSAHEGVPAAMAEAGLAPFLTAEDIAASLAADATRFTLELVSTELDTTEILDGGPAGRTLLGFLVERDMSTLDDLLLQRLHDVFAARSAARAGRSVMPEVLGIVELRRDLAAAPAPSSGYAESVAGTEDATDTVSDYRLLAERFDWPARLRSGSRGEDGRRAVLDVGCGTGRWLRALTATWPELREDREDRTYTAVDPADGAVGTASGAAHAVTTPIGGYPLPVERIPVDTAGRFDLIWAIHSLYAVPRESLDTVVTALQLLLRHDGLAVVVMPDLRSFYLRAGELALGRRLFVSAEDVTAALVRCGIPYSVSTLDHAEVIPAADEVALRRYLWDESIGNSFTPAGGAHDELPPLPTSDWWDEFRQGDVFRFPQHVQIITFRRT
jgi:SAM-dependent methyltransferase